jgi:uncharacterized protein (DUF1697 family)
MLRGINVGAHKRIKMDRLRTSLEALGFEQVKSYIQSGNVVLKTARVSTSVLSRRIEKQLLDEFGFSVSVISRTVDEMSSTIQNNPFLQNRALDPEQLHVAFLSDAPSPISLQKLKTLTAAPDQSCCVGKEIYLYLPNGTAESSLMKSQLDRVLSVVATTRNWKTVHSIHQMCLDCR